MEIYFEGKKIVLKSWLIYLILIVVFGFLIRFVFIDWMSLTWDESWYAFNGLHILQQGPYFYFELGLQDPYWFSNPPLYNYMTAFFISILGFKELAVRFSSIIFGTLTILVGFFFAKELFGRKVGIITAAILAVNPYSVIINRLAYLDTTLTFFLLLTVLFFIRFVKYKRTKDISLTWLFAGLSVFTKYSSIYILLTLILYVLLFERNLLKNKKIYLTSIIFFLVISPLLWLGFMTNFNYIKGQYQTFGILRSLNAYTVFLVPEIEKFPVSLPAFISQLFDIFWYFSIPLFLASIIGMIRAYKNKIQYTILLFMLIGFSFLFNSTMNVFHWYYLTYTIPIFAFFAAITLRKAKKEIIGVILVIALVFSIGILSQMTYKVPEEVGKYMSTKNALLIASQRQGIVGFYSGLPVMWFNPSYPAEIENLVKNGLLEYIVDLKIEEKQKEAIEQYYKLEKKFEFEPNPSSSWYIYKNKIQYTDKEKIILRCILNGKKINLAECPELKQFTQEDFNQTINSLRERGVI